MSENRTDWYYRQIENATLQVISESDGVRIFMLRKYPNSTMMSTYIIFAVGRIIITGDMPVRDNGIIAAGYDLEWFSGGLSPDYLAEKFLEKDFHPEIAMRQWREMIDQYQTELDQFRAECGDEEPDNLLLRETAWRYDWHKVHGTVIDAMKLVIERGVEDFDSYESVTGIALRQDGGPVDEFHPANDLESIGWGYDPNEIGWLAAIQRRFAECYAAMMEVEK